MKVVKIIFIALLVLLGIIYGFAYLDTWLFSLILFCVLIYLFVKVFSKGGRRAKSKNKFYLFGD
jgi:uncharacterized phage infection (PIP) family protein YhgE